MKNTISINEKKLTINCWDEIEFEEEIHEIIDMENVVVVLTMPRDDYMTSDRIYGVIDGKIAWRVQDMLEYNPDYELITPNPYTGIEVYDKDPNVVLATTFRGFRFLIDPQNGKIVGTESWIK